MYKRQGKCRKWIPKWEPRRGHFLGHLASFFCARRPWEPKWLPSLPQEPPRPVQASISVDFGLILDDFLMIFCIMWATFYLVGSLLFWLPRAFIFKFLATSSNVLGSSAGVSKVTKKCDVAHLLSSLPLCFCYLEPYFSSFWPQIFGVFKRVISELRSTARWRECRRQLRPLLKACCGIICR